MTWTMIGSDPDDLLDLASEFDAAAAELRSMLRSGGRDVALATLDARLRSVWHGHRAEAFTRTWRTVHAPRLIRLERDLTEASRATRRNAVEQLNTSSIVKACPAPVALGAINSSTPASLVDNDSGAGHEITLNSVTDQISVSASVEIVNLSEGGTTQLSEVLTPDGRVYVVDLALEGTASSVVLGMAGAGTASFEFDNRADAEAFRDQIHDVLKPDAKDIVFGGFGLLPLVKTTEAAWYAKDYSDNLVSLRTEAGGLVEAGTGAALGGRRLQGDVAATASFFADPIADEYGMVVDLAAGGTVAWGGVRADVEVSAEAEFLTDSTGEVQRVTVTLELQAQGAMDLTNPLIDAVGLDPADLTNIEMTGGRATVTAVLDITDDDNWAMAARLAGGDLTGIPALIDRSDAIIQIGRVESVDHFSGSLAVPGPTHEIGAGVAYDTTSYTNSAIYTKPPSGPIVAVTKALGTVPMG